jgi:nitrate reductase NapAB chaperone NapD
MSYALDRGQNTIPMRAYVLIDASLDNAGKIAAELRQRPGVLLADIVNGPCPIIALIEGDDPSTIAQTILFDIRKVEGVIDLTVYLSTEEQKDASVQDNIPGFASPDNSKVAAGKAKRKSREKKGRKSND